MKKNYVYILVSTVICATLTSVFCHSTKSGLSSVAIANIEALTNNENNDSLDDDCTVICSYDNCKKADGSWAGITILSVATYKRTSIVEVCNHYSVTDCPFGSTPTGKSGLTGNTHCD